MERILIDSNNEAAPAGAHPRRKRAAGVLVLAGSEASPLRLAVQASARLFMFHFGLLCLGSIWPQFTQSGRTGSQRGPVAAALGGAGMRCRQGGHVFGLQGRQGGHVLVALVVVALDLRRMRIKTVRAGCAAGQLASACCPLPLHGSPHICTCKFLRAGPRGDQCGRQHPLPCPAAALRHQLRRQRGRKPAPAPLHSGGGNFPGAAGCRWARIRYCVSLASLAAHVAMRWRGVWEGAASTGWACFLLAPSAATRSLGARLHGHAARVMAAFFSPLPSLQVCQPLPTWRTSGSKHSMHSSSRARRPAGCT